ncbi:MAG: GAF domain-containing protein, partial [Thermoleophilia bacterium]|nr:GAF domain-containing protein [Thermoleophilia bacterium]
VDDEGRLVCPAMPEAVAAQCRLHLAPRKVFSIRGPLSEAVLTASTVVHEGPLRLPQGHVPISRVLATPVVHFNRVIGVLAVANKPEPYSAEDRELLEGAAAHLGPILDAHLARQKMEAELKEAKQAAEAANRAKTRFLATISHELRTPLAGILGLLALLQQSELTEEQREHVRWIRLSAESVLGLVDDLLEAASTEIQGVRLRPVRFNLRE